MYLLEAPFSPVESGSETLGRNVLPKSGCWFMDSLWHVTEIPLPVCESLQLILQSLWKLNLWHLQARSDIIVPVCSERTLLWKSPCFAFTASPSADLIKLPTCECAHMCVCVSDVGMFYLSSVILFHLMTIPLDTTARRCVKSFLLWGVMQSRHGHRGWQGWRH